MPQQGAFQHMSSNFIIWQCCFFLFSVFYLLVYLTFSTGEYNSFCQYAFRNWKRHYVDPRLWIAIAGQAGRVLLGVHVKLICNNCSFVELSCKYCTLALSWSCVKSFFDCTIIFCLHLETVSGLHLIFVVP